MFILSCMHLENKYKINNFLSEDSVKRFLNVKYGFGKTSNGPNVGYLQ